MRTRHADRLWMIAGAAVALLLGVVTWLLLVNPQHADAAELNEQIDAANTQTTRLRKRNAELAAVHAKINKLTKTRNARAAALPPGSGIPAFLRQMQASGTAVNVDVNGISVGQPTEVKGVPGVWAVPIQLAAEGTVSELGAFLDQLQGSGQKRAVLIENTTLTGVSDDPELNLTLGVKAFVAPPAGAGAPTVTTD